MEKFVIKLVNYAWRGIINCGLCTNCPAGQKGCCSYSPVFYLADLLFLQDTNPELLQEILQTGTYNYWECSFTLNFLKDKDMGNRCRFHTDTGCRLKPVERDSICRIFLCPGTKAWREPDIIEWQKLFGFMMEIELKMQEWAYALVQKAGLASRHDIMVAVQYLESKFGNWEGLFVTAGQELGIIDQLKKYADSETEITLSRTIDRINKWNF